MNAIANELKELHMFRCRLFSDRKNIFIFQNCPAFASEIVIFTKVFNYHRRQLHLIFLFDWKTHTFVWCVEKYTHLFGSKKVAHTHTHTHKVCGGRERQRNCHNLLQLSPRSKSDRKRCAGLLFKQIDILYFELNIFTNW